MRKLLSIGLCFSLLFSSACSNNAENESSKENAGTVSSARNDITDSTSEESGRTAVYIEGTDTLTFAQKEVRQYMQWHPGSNLVAPNIAYATDIQKVKDGKDTAGFMENFESENGRDMYCALYAYDAAHQPNASRHEAERQELVKIYRDIAKINQRLYYGGTYYGHQYTRILAYAAYASYLNTIDSSNFIKPFRIEKQKKLFLSYLSQKIVDEVSVDNEILDRKEKMERQRELFKIVDDLNKRISNYFYLECATKFEYEYF